MKISFWIPATVLCAVSIAFSNSVQVGTVLFTQSDLVRKCWTENEKSLLRARLIMQDILPDPDCIDFSNPKAAVVLLDYFLACYEIINKFCYGRVQNLMLIALSDALGGYLRAYVLPSAKRAYYAGQIKYREAEQLFRLYDNIRTFLKTSGRGWARPQKLSRKNFHVSPLVITGGSYEACKQLRLIEKKGKLRHMNYVFPGDPGDVDATTVKPKQITGKPRNRLQGTSVATPMPVFRHRNNSMKGDKDKEETKISNYSSEINSPVESLVEKSENEFPKEPQVTEIKKDNCPDDDPECRNNSKYYKRVVVPLPMLDDFQNPQSIAVPFRDRPFRNLHTASSAFILEYYYMSVIKCFIAVGNTKSDIKNFNVEFHSWLVSQVLPHLNDDQWYPGFGGVLRIVETIKKFGGEHGFNDPGVHDTSYVFGKGVVFEMGDVKGKELPRNIVEEALPSTQRHVVTAVLVVSLLWMFLFCACAFYSQAMRERSLLGGYSSSSSHCETELKVHPCPPCEPELKVHPCPPCEPELKVHPCPPCPPCPPQPQPQPPCETAPHESSSRTMNFQFFVKFFKNRTHNDNCNNHDKQVCWSVVKLDNDGSHLKKECIEDQHHDIPPVNNNFTVNVCEEPKKAKQDNHEFKFLGNDELFKPILPNWPTHYCFFKNKFKCAPAEAVKSSQTQIKQEEELTMIWKKPSDKFQKSESHQKDHVSEGKNSSSPYCSSSYSASAEDDKKIIRKQRVCSCCSETCQPTSSTETIRSSQSKVKKILTSTTVECSEEPKPKHKPFIKRRTMATTEESDCDDEASTSYEGDY